MTKHFLLGISLLPALLVMPAMAAAPNTTDTAFVFGDITAEAGTPLDYMAVGGRRISTDMVGGKYRNDFPNYSMIGRSLDIPANSNPLYPATTLYVGPVNLTLRELTDNDVFKYNYQYPVAYDEETGQYVAISDPDTDVDLADWAGVVWNDDDVENKVAAKIGAGNALYTAPGVEMFSRRDDNKAAGSLSIAKTNATVDGTTVNANSISVTQGSTLTVANKATALLDTANGWYSVADQIASSGMTTLNAQTITVDGSTINLDHVVVKENNIPVGIRDAKLVINSETPTGITTIRNVASGYGALTVNGGGSLDLGGAELNFTNNTSTSHGAGLYYKDQSYGSGTQHGTNTAVLNATDITFSGNEVLADATSGSGAGVFLSGGKLSILGATNTFTDNHMNSTSIVSNRLYKTGGGAVANQSYDLESGQYGTAGSAIDADMIIGKADGSSVNMFTDNTSTTNGGAVMNRAEKTDGNATLTINGTTTFDNNSADINGGAIYNLARNNKTADVYMNNGTYTFTANSATELGGAIYNEGTMQLANATFGRVDLTDPQNPVSLGNSAETGGAIYNKGTLMFDNATTFANNSASNDSGDAFGGAIENYYGDLTFNGAATFTNNSVSSTGGAAQGGALHNLSATTTFNNGSTFVGNTTSSNGAAIYNGLNYQRAGIVNLNGNSLFENNTASGDNGIVFNVANATVDNTIAFANGNATFRDNTGIALWNQDLVTFTNMGNILFDHNTNTATSASNSAISNGGTMTINAESFVVQNNTSGKGAIGNTSPGSVFTLNATNVDFTNNTGGAIYKENDSFTINATNTISFAGNTANKAAAINNNGNYSQTTLNASEIEFTGNIDSGSYAGAIFNSGDYVKLLADKVTFSGNQANATTTVASDMVKYGGGAINNRGNKSSHQVTEIVVGKDENSIVSFENNTSAMHGGAIHARAEAAANGTTPGDAGKVTINGTATFSDNIAALNGGAISNSPVLGTSIFIINGNSTFTGNRATEGAGVYNSGDLTFNGTATFNSNIATDALNTDGIAQGGALFNSASGEVLFKKLATFTGNQAISNTEKTTVGGAINNDGTVTFEKNAVFTNNTAVDGGAIFNIGTLTLTEASSFQSNHATEGAALYNANGGTVSLTDATFRNNIATAAGGAIGNAGTITLNGTNTFIGNTANGVANDILNRGTLTIASGTTTLSGGITGNGPSATLNIAEGATLNIGTASVTQNTINLNGTMLATLRGGDNAQITASTAFNGDGELKLAFDGEGLYHVFGGEVFAKENGIDLSSVVYDLTWSDDGRDVTASLKSVEDLAEENHLTTETAAAVINLTNSSSNVLNDLAVTIQEKLATGTEEARQEVEQAQVAINPEKESVVQSVTSSVQNAVSSLAMSRLSMPMSGRNGGDAKVTGRGVWVNGIFNKAKQNDAFNGYTRGFAAGLDGTINNNLTIGAGYSFAHSDVDGSARNTEIESSSVFVYGQYRQKAWYVNGVANYTMADYSEQGTALGTPVTADYDVKSYGANVATGYRFAGGITPELSLRYLHIDGSDYVNSLGIKNELKESDHLTAALGTKYAFRIKVTEAFRLRPELSYAVKYDMLSDKQVATVTMPGLNSYALDGDRLSRIAGEFGIGLGARYKGLDVSLNYDIEAREDYTSQSGRMKFRYNF